MMMDFTIAIPTYNGENRLSLVLEKLRSQVKLESITWEVLVIDNNSTDGTANLIQSYQKEWQTLKYVFEPQQGLAFARAKAIQEAQGKYVGFLDDDNIPALDWVYQAFQFGERYPQAGAYGGKIEAEFEIPPPENIEKIIGCFAIRERGNEANPYKPEVLSLPPGAGLVVRKQAWVDCVPEKLKLVGRVGKIVVAGEDFEPLLYMHQKGWEIWYNPLMKMVHKIPAKRLENDYILGLVKSSCLPLCTLRMLMAKNLQKPVIIGRMIAGNLSKAIWYWLNHRKQLKKDIITQCELQFYLSRLYGVFYYFRQSFAPPN